MADEEAQPGQAGPGGPADQESAGDGRVRPIGLIATFVVALVLIVGVAAFFWSETYKSPSGTIVAHPIGTAVVNGQTLPHVSLSFQTYPDSTGSVNGVPIHPSGNPSWPAYGPSNVYQVPAHALVTVSVRQYDSGGTLNNPFFATVRGTVGGTAVFNGKTETSIDPNNVGHTFTVRGVPGYDPGFFLNVPLPAVPGDNQADNGQYESVTFSFVSGSKGTYAWNCEFPCGQMVAGFGGTMGAFGFMSGFIHVV